MNLYFTDTHIHDGDFLNVYSLFNQIFGRFSIYQFREQICSYLVRNANTVVSQVVIQEENITEFLSLCFGIKTFLKRLLCYNNIKVVL